ncbi:hypothetical protein ACFUEM_30690 [Streptomyces anulatus]|uniref:hypothetical protein n=1 Tax=Streptomyces anulatus TaxID=1892 RepID=UPI0035D5B0A4
MRRRTAQIVQEHQFVEDLRRGSLEFAQETDEMLLRAQIQKQESALVVRAGETLFDHRGRDLVRYQ